MILREKYIEVYLRYYFSGEHLNSVRDFIGWLALNAKLLFVPNLLAWAPKRAINLEKKEILVFVFLFPIKLSQTWPFFSIF